jgi:subfamily B ATP-binding cassette protein HlyB/CyaB
MNSGVFAFCQIANFNKIAIDTKQLSHEYGDSDGNISKVNLLRAMKNYGFKAKSVNLKLENINPIVLPAILQDNAGEYFILVGIKNGDYLVFKQGDSDVLKLTANELQDSYSGSAILITYKESTKTDKETFNIKWFIPALWKYKHIFRDVLIASFFIQIFGLFTPFFFQVVMDKVVMHNGITTLNTLAIVFMTVSVFEVILWYDTLIFI